MSKVAIVGVEGSGKTVLMAALGQYYVRPDAEGYFLEEKDENTFMMVQRINQAFKRGEWPLSTDNDKMIRLNWTLWKRNGKQKESVTDISFLDYGGEVYRLAFSEYSIKDNGESKEQYKALQEEYKEQIASLKDHIFSASTILVLINLRDVINEEVRSDRMSQMLWVTQQIFKQAKEHNPDVGIALAFAQYESYRTIVVNKGGINSVFEEYLPRLASLYPEMKLLTFTAVVNTMTDANGNEIPPAGIPIQSQGMPELRKWLTECVNAALKPKTKVITLPGGEQMEMIWCPPGEFMMGTLQWDDGANWLKKWYEENKDRTSKNIEKWVKYNIGIPARKVKLTKGFWLGKYPVTQAQWQSVMKGEVAKRKVTKKVKKSFFERLLHLFLDDPYYEEEVYEEVSLDNPSDMKSPNHPVESVSWEDCMRFCAKVGNGARLPTEAEWEYACRAGTTSALPNGKELQIIGENNAPVLDDIAWYAGNSCVDYELERGCNSSGWLERQYSGSPSGTHSVGKKAPNAWGFYDMIGNVWEWCADQTDGINIPTNDVVDPIGASGSDRVFRGGCWCNCACHCRSANRRRCGPGYRDDNLGFRFACSAGPHD